ncbi:App1 family protein [uncultured Algibacter sp.]|uniref:App1 family protein n=1 Tax=uncultured Algibacter sp. TaxID=298659 RepID=UPI00261B1E17|nr:phosphatase domain-containing protein [uncultured Algibacter sp.]
MFKKDPLQIIAFQTYGTVKHVYLRGRALEDENINLEKKGAFNLLFNTWKRFATDEIRNTKLKVKLGKDKVFYTSTNMDGYFIIDEPVDDISAYVDKEGWVKLEFSYDDKYITRAIQMDNRFPAEMLVPSSSASFGVISDIDDTILHTGLVSVLKWRVIINTLLTSVGKRIPLEGAPEFYQLLHKGKKGNEANPIFYVSHSPWNLYRYLEYFLNKNKFPKGPVILRSFPKLFYKRNKESKPRKHKEILNLLSTYPQLKFILIGDIGQHDPKIYFEIAQQYPGRIAAIYLRSVFHKEKLKSVKAMYSNFKSIPMLLVEDNSQALEHAKSHGFIN